MEAQDFHTDQTLTGRLVIIWEYLSSMSLPMNGLADYYPDGYDGERTKVYFTPKKLPSLVDQGSRKGYKLDEVFYLLYQLSDESQELLESEHQRFIKEVGHHGDYGKFYPTDLTKPNVRFKPLNLNKELKGIQLVGYINYRQIANTSKSQLIECPTFQSEDNTNSSLED